MGRPSININTPLAQQIADTIKGDQFPNMFQLCSYIADEYNKTISAEFPQINHQLIKLRIVNGVIKLPFELPRGKGGKNIGVKLTEDHKKKMVEGRKKKNKPIVQNKDLWQENMKKDFGHRSTLYSGVINGRARACIKAMCINCMGGYVNRSPEDPPIGNAIRDCRGFDCPLYVLRPFQN